MDPIPCPNCASTTHYADYTARTRFSGALVRAGGAVEFDPAATIDTRGEDERLIGYTCSGCQRHLMPFEVDGELHVRALDPKDADAARFQSDEKLAERGRSLWERHRATMDELDSVYREMIVRRIRLAAPAAKCATFQDDGEGWNLDAVYDSEQPSLDHVLHAAYEELECDDDFTMSVRDWQYAARDDSERLTLPLTRKVADATT